MAVKSLRLFGILVLSLLLVVSGAPTGRVRAGGGGGPAGSNAPLTVVASGLDHPFGLAFAANGDLYVAEAGHSDGTCPPPKGQEAVTSMGSTGAVARVSPDGTVTPFLTGLSSACGDGRFGGPTDVVFAHGDLYVLQSGCQGQLPLPPLPCVLSLPLLRVRSDGITREVAQFVSHGNGDTPNVPDENPFAIAHGPDGYLYVSDGANNSIWKVAPGKPVGNVDKPLVQFPGDPTATGLAFSKGGFLYMTLFGKGPYPPGSGKVARVFADGRIQYVLNGLTLPIGVAFSPAGTMFVLQYARAFVRKPHPHWLPGTGTVWRLSGSGALEPVISGLNFPTAMKFGPSGDLYIVVNGPLPTTRAVGQVVTAYVGP